MSQSPSIYRLCYVSGPWAYFTTQDVEKQWGDDWDDAPYEHNAGEPYEPMTERGEDWAIRKVAWEGPFVTPDEGHLNSPYSVRAINRGWRVSWLQTDEFHEGPPVSIPAGTIMREFVSLVRMAGGEVYRKS